MDNQLRITTSDGAFTAYVARPRVLPAPAVIVVHEVFGVNADVRQSCDELAAKGYLAISPDLFWRQEPGVDMTDQTEAERAKAQTLYDAFDLDAGVRDIAATLEAARALPDATGRVGVVGYCLGGLLTYLTAARVGVDPAVAYYPGNADKHLQEAGSVHSPMLVHLAQEDEYIPPDAQQKITTALQDVSQVQVCIYPGCHHAFARHRGISYDAEAAALANGRTDALLALYLKKS
jgi:carboxymethylenebutenolidase